MRTTYRHAEIELLMLEPDPQAANHYAALSDAINGENGKTCEQCGNQYARTRAESQPHWLKCRFCGQSCAASNARRKQAARTRAERIEDLEWLLGTDRPESIAVRLGYANLGSLTRTLERWGRPDLGRRLERAS